MLISLFSLRYNKRAHLSVTTYVLITMFPQPFLEPTKMRPSKQSRHLTAWTTPSAFHLDPAFTDPATRLELHNTHFFTAGNHLILHHLDLYLLRHNFETMQTYIAQQLDFWSTMSDTIQSLHWKLSTYITNIRDVHFIQPTTSDNNEDIQELLRQISHVQQEETEWVFPNIFRPPDHIYQR